MDSPSLQDRLSDRLPPGFVPHLPNPCHPQRDSYQKENPLLKPSDPRRGLCDSPPRWPRPIRPWPCFFRLWLRSFRPRGVSSTPMGGRALHPEVFPGLWSAWDDPAEDGPRNLRRTSPWGFRFSPRVGPGSFCPDVLDNEDEAPSASV